MAGYGLIIEYCSCDIWISLQWKFMCDQDIAAFDGVIIIDVYQILFHSKLEYLEIANSAKIKVDIWNQTFKRFTNVTWLTGTGHYIRHIPLRGCPFHWNISLMPHGWQNNRHSDNKRTAFSFPYLSVGLLQPSKYRLSKQKSEIFPFYISWKRLDKDWWYSHSQNNKAWITANR